MKSTKFIFSMFSVLVFGFSTPAFAKKHSKSHGDVTDKIARAYHSSYLQRAEKNLSNVKDRCSGCSAQTVEEKIENPLCDAFYDRMTQKQVVRMHVSFGYFDSSEGKETKYDGKNLGLNASTDQAWYKSLAMSLTDECEQNVGACGFAEKQPGLFTKTVRRPNGQAVTFEINMDYASLTPEYAVNTGPRAQEQTAKSAQSRDAFIKALKSDDVVIYVGHSRNGGGPDFYPPHLMENRHPDYSGYYAEKQPGKNDLLSAVRERGEAPPLLAIYSCLSEAWFGRDLHSLSPSTGYIFSQSDRLTRLDEHLLATLATIDGITRFQCAAGMDDELVAVRNDAKTDDHIRNLMSRKSPVDVHARPHIQPD